MLEVNTQANKEDEKRSLAKKIIHMMEVSKIGDVGSATNIMWQVAATHPCYKSDYLQAAAACILFIEGIAPQDRLEGMLAIQMTALHNLTMTVIERASQTDDRASFNADTDRATKLMRTFSAQIATLASYRGKGNQKITVEHVNINEGGQAIVGILNQGMPKQ